MNDDAMPSRTAPWPWVTSVALTLCAAIFFGLLKHNDYESWEVLARCGYLPADRIWDGAYWALISCTFVHFDLWHIAFNAYWLWRLGSRLENTIGSIRYLAFYLAAAFVSASFQLAFSGTTGIGASGVGYALFGFMWIGRRRYPHFATILDERTVRLFIFWLLGCIVATQLDIWSVGNAAHVSGLLFGAAVAGALAAPRLRPLIRAGLAALVAAAIVPLFWSPWSLTWLCHRAYQEHDADHFEAALAYYTRIIERDPSHAWAHANRSDVLARLGREDEANRSLKRALELDPSLKPAADTSP